MRKPHEDRYALLSVFPITILKLSKNVRGHFVTLIEVHLITCNTGHICATLQQN